ncbi:MAG: creatininase family protein [Gammaproteobacteria bacterium]
MHTTTDDSWIENLTWPQVEQRIANGAIGLLPIGAASKEHGRHLPLRTDSVQACWLADQLAARVDSLVWPIVNYGYYPSFVDYPGSISIPEEVFSATVSAVIEGILFAGVRRVIILNTGISTIPPLQSAVKRVSQEGRLTLHNVYSGPSFSELESQIAQQAFGGHADEIETSIMLAIDRSAVNLQLARPQATAISRGLFNRTEPSQANYSPDGVNGDPSLASEEKGRELLAALIEDSMAVLN